MKLKLLFTLFFLLSVGMIFAFVGKTKSEAAVFDVKQTASPAKVLPTPKKDTKGLQTAVFAGGCFWGIEAVFDHIKGVSEAKSGYSGGAKETADYEMVSEGDTGHAESVEVTFDPKQVSYEQLLKVFFSVAHNPTELNRQGPDWGTQYRSAIFYANDEQKKLAENYVSQLTKAKSFSKPIVTEITKLEAFYPAEDYHQNYLVRHPNERYIVVNDQPKIEALKNQFPDLFVSK